VGYNSKLYRIDPETGDILPIAKATLADYLSERTSKKDGAATAATGGPDEYTYNPPQPNAFPISPPVKDIGASLITDPTSNEQKSFVQSQYELNQLGKSQDFDSEKIVPQEYEPRADVHRVLKEVVTSGQSPNPLSNELQKQVGIVLSRNRFSSSKKYANGEDSQPQLTAVPLPFGKSTTEQYPSEQPVSRKVNGIEYQSIFDEMREEGIRSLLAGSGVSINNIERPSNFNTDDATKSILTSPASFGVSKIDTDDMRAERSVQSTERLQLSPLSAEQLPNTPDNLDSRYTQKSYGVLNNPSAPFDGALPVSMIALTTLLLASATVIVVATSLLFSLITKALRRPNFEAGESGILGSERIATSGFIDETSTFFANLLGIMQPYDAGFPAYFKAARDGILAFTGVDAGLGGTGLVFNLLGSAGYYNVMIRNIGRNLDIVADSTESGGGVLGGLQAVAAFIMALKNSKLIRFVDTMARIGIVLSQQSESEDQVDRIQPSDRVDRGTDDDFKNQAQNRIGRSKARLGSRELSWSHSGAAIGGTGALIPDNTRYSILSYVGGGSSAVAKLKVSLDPYGNKGFASSRLEPSEVAAIEDRLESEYVPFYLQDLRTNEIFNFHAFLQDLQDGYTAEWSTVDSYGRMDPVQIYKGTKRAISFSFMLVATSPEDFDRMWWTINRLTMMVYPQWSAGEELKSSDGSYTFRQPFSQIPTSSPLVRVRIGELIHSNYSRFNLARIFGLGQNSQADSSKKNLEKPDDIKPDTSIFDNSIEDISKISADSDNILSLALKLIGAEVAIKQTSRYQIFKDSEILDAVANGSKKKSKISASETGTIVNILGGPNVAVTNGSSVTSEGGYLFLVKLDNPILVNKVFSGGSADTYDHALIPVESLTLSDNSQANVLAGGTLLTLIAELVGILKPPLAATEFGSPSEILATNSKNPVVKSFESSQGRGLAGAITSLTYEWFNEGYTWETDQGRRAPKICKVSINFSPIHDIPMGLDSDGFARSVPYPVGSPTRATFFPELYENDKKLK
jgi:hypothetical protein